jgi:3-hydroxyisobutyrate dehydrogenase-like beta-hydroxyacid dehydrogenase
VRVYAEMSTIGHESIERIAAILAARGIACVDSPVSGGPSSARREPHAACLGPPEAVAAVRPWQLRIGKRYS